MPGPSRWTPELIKLVPPTCQGVFLNTDGVVDLDFFREALGKAAKYVLPGSLFDYSGPIYGRRFLEGDFLDHEAIRPMVESFREWSSDRAAANPSFDKCLRAITKYSRGLDTRTRRRRIRKKRLEELRRSYIKLLRRRHTAHPLSSAHRDVARGVTYFLLSLKSQFLSKGTGA